MEFILFLRTSKWQSTYESKQCSQIFCWLPSCMSWETLQVVIGGSFSRSRRIIISLTAAECRQPGRTQAQKNPTAFNGGLGERKNLQRQESSNSIMAWGAIKTTTVFCWTHAGERTWEGQEGTRSKQETFLLPFSDKSYHMLQTSK